MTQVASNAENCFCKTFCEFFAGIGLVREGLSSSGWRCVYANDICPKKQAMYASRFGPEEHFHLGDVWDKEEVLSRMTGQPWLATASFPCTDLSLAGNWKGFEGDHSSAFFGFANILDALGDRRPKVVMLENVTGFIASRNGQDFAAAAQALAELGYWLDAFVLDAQYFVPQSRPRVFMIGVHETVESSLAVRRTSDGWLADEWSQVIERAPLAIRPKKLVQLMESIELPTGWQALDIPMPTAPVATLPHVVDRDDDQEWWDKEQVDKHYAMMHDRQRAQIDAWIADGTTFVGTIYRRKRDGKTRAEVRFDGIAGCLRTPRGGSARQIVVVVENRRLRMRWMSPREYARLQGAPDFPLVPGSTNNLFGFGDAVCVPVIRHIDRHILTPLAIASPPTIAAK